MLRTVNLKQQIKAKPNECICCCYCCVFDFVCFFVSSFVNCLMATTATIILEDNTLSTKQNIRNSYMHGRKKKKKTVHYHYNNNKANQNNFFLCRKGGVFVKECYLHGYLSTDRVTRKLYKPSAFYNSTEPKFK